MIEAVVRLLWKCYYGARWLEILSPAVLKHDWGCRGNWLAKFMKTAVGSSPGSTRGKFKSIYFFCPVIFSLPLSKVEQTFVTFAKVLWVIEAPREGFYNFRLSMKFLPVLRIFRVSKYEVWTSVLQSWKKSYRMITQKSLTPRVSGQSSRARRQLCNSRFITSSNFAVTKNAQKLRVMGWFQTKRKLALRQK